MLRRSGFSFSAGGSKSLKWWTLSQRIRTFSEIPIEAAILDADVPPIYQRIAPKAVQLQQLGMSDSAIARGLGVTDKTVTKAIEWLFDRESDRGE